MDLDATFISGLACGAILSAIIFNRRLILRFACRPQQRDVTSAAKQQETSHKKKFDDGGGEYKMVLVVRNDLHMGKGKVAAQCAHAAVGAYSKALKSDPAALEKWEYTGQAKITLKVESEEELLKIQSSARKAGLVTAMIRDAGRTQIEANTRTVLGVGPAPKRAIDEVTGHLKLM